MLTYVLILMATITLVVIATVVMRIWMGRKAARLHDSHRGLFVYEDGKNTLTIDPIAAYLALESHPEFRFDLHPRLAAEGDSESIQIIARAVREAFNVPAYSVHGKPGLTVHECHWLLRAFVHYVELQKKSIELLSTTAPSTDATSQSSTAATTNASSPSGSLASAPE